MSRIKVCFVDSCKNTTVNSDKVFLTVPVKAPVRSAWFAAVGQNVSTHRGLYCCEDHFDLEHDMENWMRYKLFPLKLKCKEGVVPHKNLTHAESSLQSQLSNSAKKRRQENQLAYEFKKNQPSTSRQLFKDLPLQSTQIEAEPTPSTSKDNFFSMAVIEKENVDPVFQGQPCQFNKLDKYCQVNIRPNMRSKSVMVAFDRQTELETESPLDLPVTSNSPHKETTSSTSSTASSDVYTPPNNQGSSTSTEDFGDEDEFKMMSKRRTKLAIEKHSRFYLGLPKDIYYITQLLENIGGIHYESTLIILTKIRLYDTNFRISVDFGIDESTVSRILKKDVTKMAHFFKNLIFWPSEILIKKLLPIPFRVRYANVQSIIDCFEIEIEKPSNATLQSMTWSEYKKANTLKYLVSSTPNGVINFISKGFGGKISDTQIVEVSEYTKVLPSGCAVMADRGFKHVENKLLAKNCKLIRPPSVSAGTQLSRESSKEAKRIAALRIHVERVIRRLREFAILKPHACININLIHKTDEFVVIACGIANLQGPLIK